MLKKEEGEGRRGERKRNFENRKEIESRDGRGRERGK